MTYQHIILIFLHKITPFFQLTVALATPISRDDMNKYFFYIFYISFVKSRGSLVMHFNGNISIAP